jgi:hypothetical protein
MVMHLHYLANLAFRRIPLLVEFSQNFAVTNLKAYI